jgi:hypothetical protein
MVDIRAQIEQYLELMKIKYMWNARDNCYELAFAERRDGLPASSYPTKDPGQFKYTIKVKPGEKWIQISTDIYPIDRVPQEKLVQLLIDLLSSNRKMAEVCFDLDEERGMIGNSQEMMTQGLNFDLFREEFLVVPWTVKRFWTEIAKKHGLT